MLQWMWPEMDITNAEMVEKVTPEVNQLWSIIIFTAYLLLMRQKMRERTLVLPST